MKIVTLSLIFSVIYLITALGSGYYPRFDEGVLLNVITYDILAFITLIALQQIITFFFLLQWLKRYYSVDEKSITLTEGVFFRNKTTIPVSQIRTITQNQSWLARQLRYGTITIELINRPQAIVMPYLANPEQIIGRVNIQKDS